MKIIANLHLHTTENRGVKYAVVSVYEGQATIAERIGHLLLNAFEASKIGEIPEQSSLDFAAS